MLIESAPLISTVFLISKTITLSLFLYIMFSALRGKKFRANLAALVVGVEIVESVVFYVYRVRDITSSVFELQKEIGILIGLAGMATIGLFIILIKKCHDYNKVEMNYVPEHKKFAMLVMTIWSIAYIIGFALYMVLYVI